MMVPVYSPQTESEAAVISALLQAYEIPFFLRGAGISKLYPGLKINHINTQAFMVHDESYALTRELLAEFIKPSEAALAAPKVAGWQKLRVVIELFFFGWFVPGQRWKNEEAEQAKRVKAGEQRG